MALGAIAEMQQEVADLEREEAGLLAAAEAGTRLSDEQWTRLAAIQERIPATRAQLAQLTAARDRRLAAPTAPAMPDAGGVSIPADARITGAPLTEAPRPYRSLGEQLMAIQRTAKNPGQPDQRLFAINEWAQMQAAAPGQGMNETVGFDGGFAVQSDFIPGMQDRVYAGAQLAQYCDAREIGPNANGITYNVIDETSRADGSRGGGVQAYWIAEGASLTASRPKLAKQTVNLGKVVALMYATDEMLADATALESWTGAEVVDELAFKLDDAIYEGTGTGIPQGVLGANALVSVSKETGQAAATLVTENIEKMFSRLSARSLGQAAWYINQDVWPQIFALGRAIGTGGVPLFIPAGGLVDTPAGTLLGRPIRPIEQASTLGTVGDITLLDLSRYLLIRKGGIASAASMHVAFLTDEMAFRWVMRANGRPKPLAALTPFKGSNTTSPFVALATRA